MEEENKAENYVTQVKGMKIGPGEITWTEDEIIIEVGESKIIISKYEIRQESKKITSIEKKD